MSNEAKVTIHSPFSATPDDARVLATGWSVKRNLLGQDVLNERGDNIGTVEDLIVGGANNLMFAIVGVGGFLGMGKREVAVPVRGFQLRGVDLILPGRPKTVSRIFRSLNIRQRIGAATTFHATWQTRTCLAPPMWRPPTATPIWTRSAVPQAPIPSERESVQQAAQRRVPYSAQWAAR